MGLFRRLASAAERITERRPARRVRPARTAPVEVQIMGSNSIDVLRARDVSVGGLGVYVPHRFETCDINAEVELVITLPGLRPFLARGVIKHLTRADEPIEYFGVKFTQLADRHRELLRDYIEATFV